MPRDSRILGRRTPGPRARGVALAAESLERRLLLSNPAADAFAAPGAAHVAAESAVVGNNGTITLAAVTGAVDARLLDRIDQLAPTYYKPSWNITLEQYKAWVATIARAEGGRGQYAAHSQGALGSDVFAHRARPAFRFSTGLGPFQLDRGGIDGWGTWASIRKLDPAQSVESTLKLHFNRYGAGATLADFAATSLWFAVRNPAGQWGVVTGTDWAAHSAGARSLDWASIRTTLASNAAAPSFAYDNNIRSLGARSWSIDAADGLVADSGESVTLVGESPTWLITARTWEGVPLFDYYYTYNARFEFWVLSNPTEPTPFRYAFFREHARQVFPEGRSGNVAGVTLASAALDPTLPAVTRVHVNGSAWQPAFRQFLQDAGMGSASLGYAIPAGAAQLSVLPWAGLNQLSITFDRDVRVDAGDLHIRGVNVPTYPLDPAAFTYDAATYTATWRLAAGANFNNDRIVIDLDGSSPDGVRAVNGPLLDGDWTNPTAATGDAFPSGDGAPGGDFLFRINVLPGDADRASNRVNANDQGYVKARLNRTVTSPASPTGGAPYSIFADVTGDGRINANDRGAVKARLNSALPTVTPQFTMATAAPPALFGDEEIPSDDLRPLLA